MNQSERREYLIRALLAERPDGRSIEIPTDAEGQRALLRDLMNVRPPEPVPPDVLHVQDAYLEQRLAERGGPTDAERLAFHDRIAIWRGDITLLAADAIVNAANSQMLGCFVPGHSCIDNAIHTYAGMQLRLACAELMAEQGHEEPTGQVKVTPAFNLPSRFVFHTVGPVVHQSPAGTARGAPAAQLLRELPGRGNACRPLHARLLLHLDGRLRLPAARRCPRRHRCRAAPSLPQRPEPQGGVQCISRV